MDLRVLTLTLAMVVAYANAAGKYFSRSKIGNKLKLFIFLKNFNEKFEIFINF